jgi:hypothetical protein
MIPDVAYGSETGDSRTEKRNMRCRFDTCIAGNLLHEFASDVLFESQNEIPVLVTNGHDRQAIALTYQDKAIQFRMTLKF